MSRIIRDRFWVRIEDALNPMPRKLDKVRFDKGYYPFSIHKEDYLDTFFRKEPGVVPSDVDIRRSRRMRRKENRRQEKELTIYGYTFLKR